MQVGKYGIATGVQVAYMYICKRKLWLYTYGIKMEEFSSRVHEAKVMHKIRYPRKVKELKIPGSGIKIDFCEKDGSIHEIKMSNAVERAHILQIAYYLKVLSKNTKHKSSKGVLHYPRAKQTQIVELTSSLNIELDKILLDIEKTTIQKQVPTIHPSKSFCRKCAYYKFCFS